MADNNENDNQYWINALRGGVDQALSHYFQMYNKSLLYFATKLIQDQEESQDIVANCFVVLWNKRANFETDESVKAFLYISCRNACLNFLKHLKIKTRVQQVFQDELAQNEDTVLYQIIRSEVLSELRQEIELLPENYREVFKLIYFEHKKTDEIAMQLDLSVQTVRNYKSRSVELLKTAMLRRGITGALMLAFLLALEGR
ncbi:RNA polymerase sigma-70 factor (ECF subfamily) [Pedobacter sp. AK017]|uniref:RNA polymerase sigma-70 factor n=1 Tax=Pedobacter sp. AK017 TaxID=2723073 RepID=UPI0016210A22|nr:RNA polymerase sigma-70 factor [Pedobacter sp. AK017]MBB5441168.1 RNA polymerase sigma-70 factor (ECF subfamily) [Pedobacter sp. AK017]